MRRLAAVFFLAAAASACGDGASAPRAQSSPATTPVPAPVAGYNLREGQAVFQYYCAPCHGTGGQGDGFNAYSLDPKPRDLTDAAFKAERSDEELAGIIRIGGGAAGLSTGMPPWGRTLKARQTRNVVAYLRKLTPPAE